MTTTVGILALGTLFLAVLSAMAGAQTGSAPLSLHPENPHYFLYRGRPMVLITSGEHYGAVLNRAFDYVRYLDELQACGLNHTRLFVGSYREHPQSFQIVANTLAPAAGQFVCPWVRSSTPGNADGGNKFDLKRWDDAYFARLYDFVKQASNRGIIIEINLFCPNYDASLWAINPMNAANNINGIGNCPDNEVYALKHADLSAVQEAMTRKIVQELSGFDNLYYEVCNEPYFGGVTQQWQHHISQAIVAAEKSLPQKHLISMNIANGTAKIADPDPAISIFNFHYAAPPDAVGQNYALNRVIGDNETGFAGGDDLTYRTQGWDFVLAGGGLYNNLDYSFTVEHPDGTFADYNRKVGGGSRALRFQLKTLKQFIESFDFIRMAPDREVIHRPLPEGVTARALSEPGKQYALYLKGGTRAELHLGLPAGRYQIRWLHPRTGQAEPTQPLSHPGGVATLTTPTYSEDLALSVTLTPDP